MIIQHCYPGGQYVVQWTHPHAHICMQTLTHPHQKIHALADMLRYRVLMMVLVVCSELESQRQADNGRKA